MANIAGIVMRPAPKQSTNVQEIGYCPVQKKLAIRFANGKLYHYDSVPDDIFEDLQKAESIGSFLAKNVRGQFNHTLIDESDKEDRP